ncbi:alpha-dioxygenase PIOX-like isoform X3 [Solanum dulcamara]|uniref:alpha-dioxygenase PIOX-like isoform X3 n=1 Tax=Solanum dulcamara TaxID=45834 RepID=UPI0024865CDA|nr:alpha-dioxygenase PIOX-like isoform X3 [Solanum dulcamara]
MSVEQLPASDQIQRITLIELLMENTVTPSMKMQAVNFPSLGGICSLFISITRYSKTASIAFCFKITRPNFKKHNLSIKRAIFSFLFLRKNRHEMQLKKPDPMVVATKLLARRKFVDTGKQLNIIAASWIQFMVHDWMDHMEDTNQIKLHAAKEVASQCPLKSFKFFKSKETPTGLYEIKTGHLNRRTSWWDGSAIYGNNGEDLKKVRTFIDGKLKLSENGLIQQDENGKIISGDVRNTYALFVQEHNAICDALKKEYSELKDEHLYRHARLVTSAVIAKIHTIDWSAELLKTDILLAGMSIPWLIFLYIK